MFFKRTLTTFHFKNSECYIIIEISKYLIFFFLDFSFLTHRKLQFFLDIVLLKKNYMLSLLIMY